MKSMKNFLEKHILFPKRFGIQPYIWLFFLAPTVVGLMGYSPWQQGLGALLILIFLKAYRDGYGGEHAHLTRSFILQMVVTLILAVNPWFQTWGIQIFTGFSMGFWEVSDRRFRTFLWIYYSVAVLSYVGPIFEFGFQGLNPSSLVWIFVGTVFILISPIFSKLMSRTYNVTEENKALEARVRQLERERIAYDLHDTLGQTFSTISLEAELASKLIDKKPDAAKAELAKIADNARESLTLVREIVSGLKEETLVDVLADKEKSLALAAITLTITGDGANFPSPAAAVLKEALTNVVRHSKASLVSVTFDETDEQYQLTISDNGIGLSGAQPSHGMIGMKKRVEESGGVFSVSTERGTSLTVCLPKKENEAVSTDRRKNARY